MAQIIEPIKANVELITGARPGSVEVTDLGSDASLSDVITKVNQILSRINQSG
jgi:regulation of enolase protein 1 (concanavalin A-like superfamily)